MSTQNHVDTCTLPNNLYVTKTSVRYQTICTLPNNKWSSYSYNKYQPILANIYTYTKLQKNTVKNSLNNTPTQ